MNDGVEERRPEGPSVRGRKKRNGRDHTRQAGRLGVGIGAGGSPTSTGLDL